LFGTAFLDGFHLGGTIEEATKRGVTEGGGIIQGLPPISGNFKLSVRSHGKSESLKDDLMQARDATSLRIENQHLFLDSRKKREQRVGSKKRLTRWHKNGALGERHRKLSRKKGFLW